ncbi:MFS transporter [Actinopolymorpha pittospori]|uniref:EmrB/QacA subfamily drug resistance transporter n=2 Tax=Actinopolymorpha pittospori TaxID=648752 RepID=A0A927R922_9ACTN|nr:EmrB/QacA subfamily drug resistance transporter [Actinopolymorpha pittospori]
MLEMSHRHRLLVLGICCTSLLIVSMDSTVLNVALPTLRRDLGASLSDLQWTIDAYTLVLASLLLLGGSMADRFGRKRVFQIGLVVFTAGSLLCSVAPSLELLVVFRVLQAVGGSMLNPVAVSIITNTFTDPRERARAVGVWGSVFGISMATGPLVGGTLVEAVSWRAIFWINIPIGLAALALTHRFVPESRAAKRRRFDPVGQVLVIALLGFLTYGIIEGPGRGWLSPWILGCFLIALLALVALLRYERRHAEPLINPRFFGSAPFSGATAIAVSTFAALGGFLFINTLYLQDVRGLSPLDAGLWTLPMAVMIFVSAPLSGRMVGTFGSRPSLLIGGSAVAVSGVLLGALEAETFVPLLFTSYVLFGLGVGMVNAPITTTAVSGMPLSQSGVAAAVATTSRQVGQALGVAVIGAALAVGVGGGSAASMAGAFARADFVDAARPAWWIITGCGVLSLVVGAVTTTRWAERTATRTAEVLRTGT